MAHSYYAIVEGRTKGIVSSYQEMVKSTRQYPGAKLKGFNDLNKAKAWLNSQVKQELKSEKKYYAIRQGLITGVTENKELYEKTQKVSNDFQGKAFDDREKAMKYLGFQEGEKTYYVLHQGQQSGIYLEKEAFNYTLNPKGKKTFYMWCSNLKKAKEYLNKYNPQAEDKESQEMETGLIAYTDSSKTDGVSGVGIGVVIQKDGVVIKEYFQRYDRKTENLDNQQGEVLAVIKAIHMVENMDEDEVFIYTDSFEVYKIVNEFLLEAKKEWLHHSKAVDYLYSVLEHTHVRVGIHKVKAHSGVLLNERADWLARRSLNIQKTFTRLFDLKYRTPSICLGWD